MWSRSGNDSLAISSSRLGIAGPLLLVFGEHDGLFLASATLAFFLMTVIGRPLMPFASSSRRHTGRSVSQVSQAECEKRFRPRGVRASA